VPRTPIKRFVGPGVHSLTPIERTERGPTSSPMPAPGRSHFPFLIEKGQQDTNVFVKARSLTMKKPKRQGQNPQKVSPIVEPSFRWRSQALIVYTANRTSPGMQDRPRSVATATLLQVPLHVLSYSLQLAAGSSRDNLSFPSRTEVQVSPLIRHHFRASLGASPPPIL